MYSAVGAKFSKVNFQNWIWRNYASEIGKWTWRWTAKIAVMVILTIVVSGGTDYVNYDTEK